MINTFVNPVLNPDAKLGVSAFDETDPVRLWPQHDEADVETVIRSVYRQVLGNAHVMESERLVVPESQLKRGEISVREFVRQVAKSDLYRTRFFDACPRYRAIELNFKHLLGRAPESYEETSHHSQLLDQGGYEAEIDAYLDSEEYCDAFGEDVVPHYRGYKTHSGRRMVEFTHMFQLLRGASSSDQDQRSQNRPRLNGSLFTNRPSRIAPVTGAPYSWSLPRTTTPTDVDQLLANVFGLRGQASTRTGSTASPAPLPGDTASLQQQYQGYQAFVNSSPIERWPNASESELDLMIRAVYRQVLGNAYVMESERLPEPESQFRSGNISVREFVRQVAKSDLYRTRFFDPCPRYRTIELNFKHLLGRAPADYAEMREHSQILDQYGFAADIDAYLDSQEYQQAFGENVVPYYRGYKTQVGQKLLAFTNLLQLLPSASSSDKDLASGNRPRLTRSLLENNPFGKRKATDVNQLLADVFKPKTQQPDTPITRPTADSESALQRQIQDQETLIVELQRQLAELRPFASLGAAVVRQSTFSRSTTPGDATATAGGISAFNNHSALADQAQAQATLIDQLRQQVAEARSLAWVGEARANKWRSRVFNG